VGRNTNVARTPIIFVGRGFQCEITHMSPSAGGECANLIGHDSRNDISPGKNKLCLQLKLHLDDAIDLIILKAILTDFRHFCTPLLRPNPIQRRNTSGHR
jgi:hypothetical protein